MFKELVIKNRSYRRFTQKRITSSELRELIDLARLTPSGRNAQPLKYYLISSKEGCSKLFGHLAWAGYLENWPGPVENERPTAYVIVLGDTTLSSLFGIDPGIAAQTLLLGAVEKGMGGCILGSIQREEIRAEFNIAKQFEILYVIALGYPIEQVAIESMGADGDVKYWRDAQQVHHVPKRALADLIAGEE